MKNIVYLIILLSWSMNAQISSNEENINSIIEYVQKTQQEEIFEVKNKQKQNNKGDDVIISYYFELENIFCIIQKEFSTPQREVIYYLKNNELVLLIFKENSLEKEIYYLINDGELINPEDLSRDFPLDEAILQLNELIEEF